MERGTLRGRATQLISRPVALVTGLAFFAVLLILAAYALSDRRSSESLRQWVEQQNFVFLVPARSGLLPGDVIEWPSVAPGMAPSGDSQLFERSAEVLGFADERMFERTGPYDVTLSGSVEAGLRTGALPAELAAQAKASGAETFELVMKDVLILEVPVAALQRAIGADADLLQALRNPNRTVVSRVLRPGRFHYRFGTSGSTGFTANLKRLLGGEGDSEVEGGGSFNSTIEVKSDRPLVIGIALAKLDLAELSTSASGQPTVKALDFDESRSLQTDPNAALWPVGSTVRIRFLNGSAEQKSLFREAMGEWLKHANLSAAFVESGASDVRVRFPSEYQGWSYVGQTSLRVPPDQPTMELGFPVNGAGAKASYLHEIGHALGLVHEFQNPEAQPLWNREAVIAHFSGAPQFWTRDIIERTFFDASGYPGSRLLDLSSIMSYPVPGRLLRGGRGFTPGNTLSPSDRSYVRDLYPPDDG